MLLFTLFTLVALCAVPAVPSLTAQELTERAAATQRALQQTGARWTMRRAPGKTADLGVRVTRFGKDTHWELIVIEGGKVTVLRTITELGEVHVSRRPGKPPEVTRPWEEVLDPQWMVLIGRTAPGFFRATGDEQLLSDDGEVSRWRSRVSDTWAGAREKLGASLGAALDGGLPGAEAVAQGVVVSVEDATGFVLHADLDEARGTFFSDFELLRERPAVFGEPVAKPPAAISSGWMKDAMAWGWVPGWRPGGPEGEADTVLVAAGRPPCFREGPG